MSKAQRIKWLERDVNTLKEQLEAQTKGSTIHHKGDWIYGFQPYDESTLNGRVEAIAEFLGVDFKVTPKQSAKVKAVKKKGKK